MNKLEFVINNSSYEVVLDRYKILFGNNFDVQYEIIKCFKNYFNKTTYSEYAKENNLKNYIKLDENYIDIRNSLFFEISYDYDFINDAKLGTKSLILKYFEHMLDGIEYNEDFNTIKELLSSFVDLDIKDKVDIEVDNLSFFSQCDDFNFKSLIKFIIPCITKETFEINNIDISYEEIIMFQIKIIKKIAEISKKKIFVIGRIPLITKNILEELTLLKDNVLMICVSQKFPVSIDINRVLFTELKWLDFDNEDTLLDFLLNYQFEYNIEKLKNKIISQLNCYDLKHKILFDK